MTKQNDSKDAAATSKVTPIEWQQARSQPRVRPQWDPAELANKLLDDMERGGRLDRSKRS